MKEKINALAARWKADKLRGSLGICWAGTIFSAFFSNAFLSFAVPLVGTVFPFRILLPISAALYILYAIREKERLWRDASVIERSCYIFIAALLLYSAASLPRALDFAFTFRRLFNFSIDLCFFFLLLRICRDKQFRRITLAACAAAMAVQCLMGVYEVFFGGIFNPGYDNFKRFRLFNKRFQFPLVSWANTNDYASAMVFCGSALLLAVSAKWKNVRRSGRWLTAISLCVLYFLVKASSARLVLVSFWLILAGFAMFLLAGDKKRLWIPLVVLTAVCGIQFATQYRYIVPSVKEYFIKLEEYRHQKTEPPSSPNVGETSEQTPPPAVVPPKLDIQIEPSTPLDKQFFNTDEETGEKVLRNEGSAGIRAHLLIHAFNCFRESYGLGTGLGNTETLAAQRGVVPKWEDKPQNSIHCFVARLIADCGIFALLPLCGIALLLIKAVWGALRRKDQSITALALLYFMVLLAYPFLSTSSSDSQDNPAMWIYLAAVTLAPTLLFVPEGENTVKGVNSPDA